MKTGESVIRLRALKDIKCHECHGYIYAGQPFLLDIIPYTQGYGQFKTTTRHKHCIHEGHWKGPKEVIIDRFR